MTNDDSQDKRLDGSPDGSPDTVADGPAGTPASGGPAPAAAPAPQPIPQAAPQLTPEAPPQLPHEAPPPLPRPAPQPRPQATHFGYQSVDEGEKARKVRGVFDSVAARYDLMNDLMSGGLHRLWKRFAVGQAALRPGMKVLDLATGSGDLARAMARRPGVQVWMTDINAAMLRIGRDRAIDEGLDLPAVQCDAERLPFRDGGFDRVTVAFGLRNMTHKDLALREMYRVLNPGGRVLVLEFSRVWKPLTLPYNAFSFAVLPALGRLVARDAQSYRYLAESIRMHPDQQSLARMMETAGFSRVRYFNLAAGVVALHQGVKI
jgi:demethylmenaquinone methyltransferase/2-methoxy-6-polyprenyl-1,4-benzoquinol methylase